MKIQFLPEENLIQLKSNLYVYRDQFMNPTNEWIKQAFDGELPFKDTKYEVEDFVLDMSQSDPFRTEFENVKRVYSRMKFLSDSQASDERLWSALCIGPFYEYVKYRWKINEKSTEENIKQHFLFSGPIRRALIRNAMARLWWIGRLTYNDKDGFLLTEFVCEHADYIMHILERNTSNNQMIIRAFLHAIIDAQNEGIKINTDKVGELSKYLNLLGGVYILDCLTYEQIYNKIYKKILES